MFWPPPQNVTFFHSKLLLDNTASFTSWRMKDLRQKWKVKLIFRDGWNSLMAWPDWPPIFYNRSTPLSPKSSKLFELSCTVGHTQTEATKMKFRMSNLLMAIDGLFTKPQRSGKCKDKGLRYFQDCRGYGYPWIYPCVDIRRWCTGRRPGWVQWLSVLWLLFDWCEFHFSEFLFNMEDWKTLLTETVFYDDIFCSAPTCIR